MAVRARGSAAAAAAPSADRPKADPGAELGGDDRAFLRRRPEPRTPSGSVLKIADLFAGCGALSLGAVEGCASLGHEGRVVLAAELDETIAEVFRANFRNAWVHPARDVWKILDGKVGARGTRLEAKLRYKPGSVDLLLGGPPCQGHSDLNNHTRRSDPKNALYLRMVRAAERLEPTSIAIENVPGVVNDKGRVVDRAIERLEKLGYHVATGVVRVADLGVPQLRVRHVLLASTVEAPSIAALVDAHRREVRSLEWAIGDLEQLQSDELFDSAPALSKENESRARWLLKNARYDLPNWKRPDCHREKPDHKYKSMYGRLRWDEPAQTITTGFGSPGQGRYLHPSQLRTLTPHEAARIQFFPDWFDFRKATSRRALAHCIGNAVPPKLGFSIARYLVALASDVELPAQPALVSSGDDSSEDELAAE